MYHVSKVYEGDLPALSDITTRIDKGEFVFLTGASGAGKTTFLKLLFRELRPTSGQILVNGVNIAVIPHDKVPAVRREIGVVFQDFRLLMQRGVVENVDITLRIQGVPREERRKRALTALRDVGLGHKVGSTPPHLSGGEQQRVAIARAIVGQPRLLLADEPTGNLDPDLSLQIMDLLEQTSARGTTVVVATHDLDLLRRYHHRRLVLEQGRLSEKA